MGHEISRPIHEGVGQKPETEKPFLRSSDLIKSHLGERPTTPKPQVGQPTSQGQTQVSHPASAQDSTTTRR
jgi:hypothetical protein